MEPLRILIADDHPVFRDGVRALLAGVPDIEIVGEAATGAGAIEAARSLEPDVVLMDLHMPECDGIEATRTIMEVAPGTGILVLTMFEDDDSVLAAMRAGARGYLLKGAGPADVVRAVRAVGNGEAIFGAAIAHRLIDYFTAAADLLPVPTFPGLTDRERDVLELMARGLNNVEIAQQLMLQPKTVRNRVSSIFAKLQVADRAQAIVLAREAGLGVRPARPR
jgi:DNA-binding NarL/FixJ family response regulator